MSVYKRTRKDGKSFTWYCSITINGVHHQKRLPTARTKGQAIEAERQFLREIHDGTNNKTGSMTLKEFFDNHYLKWTKENKRSWKEDVHRGKTLLAHFGNKRLSEISVFAIESYKIKRRNTPIVSTHKNVLKRKEKPRALASINREICLLSAIYRLAIEKKIASANPCIEVDLYPEQGRTRYLKPEEEDRLMPVLIGEREHLRDLVILAIHTGMRVSELFKLTPGKLDFIRDVIHVTETKTDEDRQVPMNQTVRALLLRRDSEAKAKGWRYLFTNPETGTRYTSIKTAWQTACRLAGIVGLRFHDLRHTFGTRTTDAGTPLTATASVMGHASTRTTERYAHATDEGRRRAVLAIEKPRYIAATAEETGSELKLVNR